MQGRLWCGYKRRWEVGLCTSRKPLWMWLWAGTPRVSITVAGLSPLSNMYQAPTLLLPFLNLPPPKAPPL